MPGVREAGRWISHDRLWPVWWLVTYILHIMRILLTVECLDEVETIECSKLSRLVYKMVFHLRLRIDESNSLFFIIIESGLN